VRRTTSGPANHRGPPRREIGFLFEAPLENLWYEKSLLFWHPQPAKNRGGAARSGSGVAFKAEPWSKRFLSNASMRSSLFWHRPRAGLSCRPCKRSSAANRSFYDVLLEEWVTSTNEIPPTPTDVKVSGWLRTTKGSSPLGRPFDSPRAVVLPMPIRIWETGEASRSAPRPAAEGWLGSVLDRNGPAGRTPGCGAPAAHRSCLVREGFHASRVRARRRT